MVNSIKAPTQIFLIGQAPQRDPYTSLFSKLESLLAQNQISITWINCAEDQYWNLRNAENSYLPVKTHEPKLVSKVTDNQLASYVNTNGGLVFEPAIDFAPLVNPEESATSVAAVKHIGAQADKPIVIVLPWQYSLPHFAHEGVHESLVSFPRVEKAALRIADGALKNASYYNIEDDLLNITSGEYQRNLIAQSVCAYLEDCYLEREDKKNPFSRTHYSSEIEENFSDYSTSLTVDLLEKIVESNWASFEKEVAGQNPETLTELQQSVIDSLRLQANETRIELGKLRENRDVKREEIQLLEARQTALLSEIASASALLDQKSGALDIREARLAALENDMQITYATSIDLLLIEMKNLSVQTANPSPLRKMANFGPSKKKLNELIFELARNDFKQIFEKHRAGKDLNTYEATALVVMQFGIELFPRNSKKVDPFIEFRLDHDQICEAILNSFDESEAKWLNQMLNRLPDNLRDRYVAMLSANELPASRVSIIEGKDIIEIIREKIIANSDLPIAPLLQLDEKPMANGATLSSNTQSQNMVMELGA